MAELAPSHMNDAAPMIERLQVSVAKIEFGPRLRAVDDDWALAVATSVERDGGLIHPIEIRRLPGGRYRLVVGGHRLRGYQLRGWGTIDASLFSGTAAEARKREIAENVIRRELSPFDRAANIAELYELERELLGIEATADSRTVGAKARWSQDAADTVSGAYRLQDQIAEKIGLSTRTVRRELQLHAMLSPGVRQLLTGHPVAESAGQLRLLARQADQTKIAHWLQTGEIETVAEGIARISPRAASDPSKKHFSAFIGAFARMSARDQRRALEALKLPSGVALSFPGGKVG